MLRRNFISFFTTATTKKEVVAVFKPAHVPLFSPLQALHDTFDIKSDKSDSLTNRVLRAELIERQQQLQKQQQPVEENEELSPQMLKASNTATPHEDDEEEIVRFDDDTSIHNKSSLFSSAQSSSSSSSIIPDVFKKKTTTNSTSMTNNNKTSSSSTSTSSNNQEVRFPLPVSSWFSEGVTLAARTPASFAFLYHCACIGAVRREYHALCRVPKDVARSLMISQQNKNKNKNRTDSSLMSTSKTDDNQKKIILNPHIKRFNELQKQKQQSLLENNNNNSSDRNNKDDLLALSKPITTSGLFLKRENYNITHQEQQESLSSYSLATSGWVQGATARLSDLVQSKSYRPDIDGLFLSSSPSSSSTQNQLINNNNKTAQKHHYWTARKPHPFIRQNDILAPVKPSLLPSIGSASHVDFQFVVEEDGFIYSPSSSSNNDDDDDNTTAIVHLKLNVLGLQSEASIRCALAAAGFPVVDDFEYDHQVAKALDYQFSSSAALNPHQHFFDKNPKNFKKQSSAQLLRPLAVDYNRMLTPTEMLIRNALIEQQQEATSTSFYTRRGKQSSSSSSLSLQPKLFCSKIIYPSPTSDRNVGILRHLIGPSTTLKDQDKKARKRVPTQDLTATSQFILHVAEAPELPEEYRLRERKEKNVASMMGRKSDSDDEYQFIAGDDDKKKTRNKKAAAELWLASATGDSQEVMTNNLLDDDDVIFSNVKVVKSPEAKEEEEQETCTFRDNTSLEEEETGEQASSEIHNIEESGDISLDYRRKRDARLLSMMNTDNVDDNNETRHQERRGSRMTTSTSTRDRRHNNSRHHDSMMEDSGDVGGNAREIILEQMRSASENNEISQYENRRKIHHQQQQKYSPNKNNIVMSTMNNNNNQDQYHLPPGIHRTTTSNNNNNNRSNKIHCRYCYGPHPVTQCPKLNQKNTTRPTTKRR